MGENFWARFVTFQEVHLDSIQERLCQEHQQFLQALIHRIDDSKNLGLRLWNEYCKLMKQDKYYYIDARHILTHQFKNETTISEMVAIYASYELNLNMKTSEENGDETILHIIQPHLSRFLSKVRIIEPDGVTPMGGDAIINNICKFCSNLPEYWELVKNQYLEQLKRNIKYLTPDHIQQLSKAGLEDFCEEIQKAKFLVAIYKLPETVQNYMLGFNLFLDQPNNKQRSERFKILEEQGVKGFLKTCPSETCHNETNLTDHKLSEYLPFDRIYLNWSGLVYGFTRNEVQEILVPKRINPYTNTSLSYDQIQFLGLYLRSAEYNKLPKCVPMDQIQFDNTKPARKPSEVSEVNIVPEIVKTSNRNPPGWRSAKRNPPGGCPPGGCPPGGCPPGGCPPGGCPNMSSRLQEPSGSHGPSGPSGSHGSSGHQGPSNRHFSSDSIPYESRNPMSHYNPVADSTSTDKL